MVAPSDSGIDRCAIPGCPSEPADRAGIPLCADHLAVAAEAHGELHGSGGLLPEPCVLCGSRLGTRFVHGWACAVCEWPHGEHPDTEFAPPRVDVVYYLRYGERVKIGTTVNPRQRFTALWHDEVLAFERGDRRLEHRRHEQFRHARAGTSEWFRLTDDIREHADVLAGGVDPWDRWRRWVAEATAVR